MQIRDIEIFLETASSRNITKASEQLSMSQSVVSTKIKKLEQELGYPLFVRNRGGREIELTRQGQEFISVAKRWLNLFEEAELIRENAQMVLRIAAPESVYYDYLEPRLIPFLEKNPEVSLKLHICDSSEVYAMMGSGIVDFGFVSYESARSDIVLTHLYDQSFRIVSYSELPLQNGLLSPAELNPSLEIRLSGGNFSSVSLWREKWFPGRNPAKTEINSPHMMVGLLKLPGTWALLPTVSANSLRDLYGVRLFELTDPPESRKILLLRHGGKPRTDAVALMSDELGIPH